MKFLIIIFTTIGFANEAFADSCSQELEQQQSAAELAIRSPGTPGADIDYSKKVLSTIEGGDGDDCETLQRVKNLRR